MVAECSQAEQTRTITAEDGTVREGIKNITLRGYVVP